MATLDEVVKGLYDAAAGLEPWPAALHRVSLFTDSWFAQLVGVHKPSGRVAFSIQSDDAPIDGVMDYVRHYHQLDPHTNHAFCNPIGIAYNGERIVPSRLVASHPFYRDFWAPYHARYTIGTKVVDDDELVGVIALLRRTDQSGYTQLEERSLESLSYHVAGAVQIMRRVSALQVEASIGQTLLERTTRPSFLIEPNRAVRFVNGPGQEVLANGKLLVVRAGFLCCADPDSDGKMIERMEALAHESATSSLEKVPPSRTAFGIRNTEHGQHTPACLWSILPEGTMGAFGSSALVLLTLSATGSAASLDPVVLAAMYDLTPAETRVALAIHEGLVVKTIASRQRVTGDAIRYHVKNLFKKIGVRNQRELVLALQSVAFL